MTADPWSLPEALELEGERYAIHPDFRDILQLMEVLERPDLPQEGRLYVALRLFYPEFAAMPRRLHPAAAKALMLFLAGGREEAEGPAGPKLLDWQQDAELILSDINRVAGQEVRALPFVHWWTFLAWFGAIGEGRLSAVVGIRRKLARGQRLEDWEQEYYRENRDRIQLRQPETPEDRAQKQALLRRLEQREEEHV